MITTTATAGSAIAQFKNLPWLVQQRVLVEISRQAEVGRKSYLGYVVVEYAKVVGKVQ